MNKGKIKKYVSCLLIAMCLLSFAACSKKEGGSDTKEVDLSELHQAVKDAYGEQYYPNMELDAATLETITGVTADMCEEVVAEGPLMSASVDTFIAIKAAEGKADSLEEALNSYRDYLINDAFQYPTNKVKVQASQVVRHGDYVFFVLLGDIPFEAEEQGEEAILEAAEAGVKIGVDTINSFFE